jgi:hypothetical protein
MRVSIRIIACVYALLGAASVSQWVYAALNKGVRNQFLL